MTPIEGNSQAENPAPAFDRVYRLYGDVQVPGLLVKRYPKVVRVAIWMEETQSVSYRNLPEHKILFNREEDALIDNHVAEVRV